MQDNNQYQQYQALSINTMTPGERIILLYEQLYLQISRSVLLIKNNKPADAHNCIIKAEKIILYLIDILDLSYSISKELLNIYEVIYKQLINANMEKDEETLQKMLPLITELKNTWQQAEQDIRKKQMLKENI